MPVTLQNRTLRLYGELLARQDNWQGKLVLTAGHGCASTGLAAATSIAGGTSLSIDPDQGLAKAALRGGSIDFLVNTLDEAIRVLKNEIRQYRPLGVALIANPETVLAEISERGLLPDLTINAPSFPGREHLTLTEDPTPPLTDWLVKQGWQETTVTTPPALNGPRQAWLRGITAYQRSATREPRALWLTSAEQEVLEKKYPPTQ